MPTLKRVGNLWDCAIEFRIRLTESVEFCGSEKTVASPEFRFIEYRLFTIGFSRKCGLCKTGGFKGFGAIRASWIGAFSENCCIV